jgi:hypothetical protein
MSVQAASGAEALREAADSLRNVLADDTERPKTDGGSGTRRLSAAERPLRKPLICRLHRSLLVVRYLVSASGAGAEGGILHLAVQSRPHKAACSWKCPAARTERPHRAAVVRPGCYTGCNTGPRCTPAGGMEDRVAIGWRHARCDPQGAPYPTRTCATPIAPS